MIGPTSAGDEAAEFVRAHADGNETVPTVAVGSTVLVNPSAAEVLAVVRREAPGLVSDDVELPRARSLFRRR